MRLHLVLPHSLTVAPLQQVALALLENDHWKAFLTSNTPVRAIDVERVSNEVNLRLTLHD